MLGDLHGRTAVSGSLPHLPLARTPGPEVNPTSVVRPARPRGVGCPDSDATRRAAVGVHHIDLGVSLLGRIESETLAIRRPAGAARLRTSEKRQLHRVMPVTVAYPKLIATGSLRSK